MAAAACLLATAAFAVDVNGADQAGLETVKGIGPQLSERILAERRRAPFKDWRDLRQRVPGLAAARLSGAGLTVDGAPFAAPRRPPLRAD